MPFGGSFPEPEEIVARAIAFIIGITVHEFMHAWTAMRLGDDTPVRQGRVTLNPIAHFDPIGFLFGLLLIFGIAPIAWGRPVEVNPSRLQGGRRGMALVAAAGPLSNLALAVVGPILIIAVLRLIEALFGADALSRTSLGYADELIGAMLFWNVALFSFNLIPIPPLDGFGILLGLVPDYWVPRLEPLRQYSLFILLLLMFLPNPIQGGSLLGAILRPVQLGALAIIQPVIQASAAAMGFG